VKYGLETAKKRLNKRAEELNNLAITVRKYTDIPIKII